jgi:outer membrane receptor protein involved in Fe transport
VRDPFPNNTVPASLFDPIGKALLGRYPAPDAAGTANNYIRQAVQNTTNRNGVARGDWRISDRDSLFVRFSAARLALNAQPPLPEPAQTPATQPADSRSIGGGYTRTFTPTTVNELRFTWTRQTSDQESVMARDEIVPGALDPRVPTSIPMFSMPGYAALGGEPSGVGNNPSLRSEGIYNFSDNVSISKGKHMLQAGFDAQIIRLTSMSALNGRGSFTFSGVFTQNPQSRPGTGSPVADLLLGTADSVTTGTIAQAAEREHNLGFYVQDRWALTPQLTVTAGLRYELFSPATEAQNQLANFVLDDGDPLYGKLVLAGTQGKPASLVELPKKDFSPRLGFAWRVPGSSGLVIRSAFGMFYAQDEGTGLTNRLTNNPPFVGLGAQSIVSDQLQPASGFILSRGSVPRPAPIDRRRMFCRLPTPRRCEAGISGTSRLTSRNGISACRSNCRGRRYLK